MEHKNKLNWLICIFFLLFTHPIFAANNPFKLPEIKIKQSPSEAKHLSFTANQHVIDFAVHPNHPIVAVLIDTKGKQQIIFWKIADDDSQKMLHKFDIPKKFNLMLVRWHPDAQTLFLLGSENKKSIILKTHVNDWQPTVIYRSKQPLNGLAIGPRPFQIGYDEKQHPILSYRVFFGIKKAKDQFTTHSITEKGSHEYAVLDSNVIKNDPNRNYSAPHTLAADSALPIDFHPAGHILLWESNLHCFNKAIYGRDNWENISGVVPNKLLCGGEVTYSPNGLSILHWRSEDRGVTLINSYDVNPEVIAKQYQFLSLPKFVADGKGIVGLVKNNREWVMRYIPLQLPLADVSNAWMFIESKQDRELFSSKGGLFRPLSDSTQQLYQLYDSENYLPDTGYDASTPTRPYLVTTDIFWEVYSAAFEGIFIVSERQAAIANFWNFVQKAEASLKVQAPDSKMAKAFAAILAVRDGNRENNVEASKIMKADGSFISAVTNDNFDYADLKPRGHYTLDDSFQTYFKASKYLMAITLNQEDVKVLQKLPKNVTESALDWIKVYEPFIAPSNAPLVWSASYPRASSLHPEKDPQIFPLSWGLDNEILNNTVFHRNWPLSQQVCGKNGCRVLPSGLDIATVFGSKLAKIILNESGEFDKYPPLKNQIRELQKHIQTTQALQNSSGSLYQRWIEALATQWASHITSPENVISSPIWQTKRLQTGLGSWVTLRHATLLVNARTGAEAGEGGYEELVMEPPRGYVEPDPKTFEAIANLFDATIYWVKSSASLWSQHQSAVHQKAMDDLLQGIIRRLIESRDQIRIFHRIAEKEIHSQSLTPEDYDHILHVGRAAEHNFLVFKSLAQKNYALSNPDPMAKIADVASSSKDASKDRQFLLVGVGAPLEWDQIIAFNGRREIVKGAIYSYYEFANSSVMTDDEWRKNLSTQARPTWIAPYVINEPLSLPPKTP